MYSNVNFRMDSDVKSQMTSICNQLGMSLSTAFNIFANAFVRNGGIPFDVTVEIPNETTLAAMASAERGEDLYGPFDSVAEMMEALNA